MKKKIIDIALIGASMVSCNSEIDLSDAPTTMEVSVTTSVGATATRAAATTGETVNNFGLFIKSGAAGYSAQSNYTRILTAPSSWSDWTASVPQYWSSYHAQVQAIAYAPYQATSPVDATAGTMALTAGDTDWLYYYSGAERPVKELLTSEWQLPVTFNHAMSRLSIHINLKNELDGYQVNAVEIGGLNDKGALNFTLATPTISSLQVEKKTIAATAEAMVADGYQATFSSFLVPQKATANQLLIKVTVKKTSDVSPTNKTYTYRHTATQTFAVGTAYKIGLMVGKDMVKITDTGITIDTWGNNTVTTGSTTNITIPDAGSTDVAGIFVHYTDADAANANNVKLSAASNWMIDHVWKSQEAIPHIVIYSPYDAAATTTYTSALKLANGSNEANNDYRYASINSNHTQKVSELLTNGKLNVTDYQHKMCKLSIAFTDASGKAITPTTVTLKGIYTVGTLTLNTGAVVTTGSQSSVSLTATNGKYPDYYIVPQTIAAGSWLITATIDGKSYEYYTDSTTGLPLAEGNHVTLTLKLPVATRAAATGKMNGTITLNNSWK